MAPQSQQSPLYSNKREKTSHRFSARKVQPSVSAEGSLLSGSTCAFFFWWFQPLVLEILFVRVTTHIVTTVGEDGNRDWAVNWKLWLRWTLADFYVVAGAAPLHPSIFCSPLPSFIKKITRQLLALTKASSLTWVDILPLFYFHPFESVSLVEYVKICSSRLMSGCSLIW